MRKLSWFLGALVALTSCNYQRDLLSLESGGAASFAAVQRNVLGPQCMSCHAGAASPMGADFSTYETIMAGGWVIANDSAKSPIFDSVAQGRMPKNKPRLPAASVELIRRWIDTGALKEDLPPLPPLTATYKSISERIFANRCNGCHDGKHPKTELDLRTYEKMMAFDNGFQKAVEPSDPDASSLFINVSDGTMPPVGGPLSEEEVKAIGEWIRQGAKKEGG